MKSIEHDFHAVRYSDGIDAREARAIAQSYYLRDNVDKDIMLSDPEVSKDTFLKDTWNVVFSTKGKKLISGVWECHVFVDSKAGVIKGESCWPNIEEGLTGL